MSQQFDPFPPAASKPLQATPSSPFLGGDPAGIPGWFQFEYLRAYNYIFENPNWLMNVVWWSLCILVAGFLPVLPYLVVIGHMFEMIVSLHATRGTRYPDFDLNRFGEYLSRSIWPFLVGIIFFLPMFVLIYAGIALSVGVGIAAAAAGGNDVGPVLGLLIGGCGFVVVFVFVLAVGLLATPMMLRAGLQENFAAGFDLGWAFDFVKKTWLEMILATLFVQLTGIVLSILGFMALCIGIYPASALMMMAHTYMQYQLYQLYLSRGGQPIAIKPPPPTHRSQPAAPAH